MNFKKISVISLAFVLALGLTIQPATAKVSLGVDVAQWFDATENDNGNSEIGFSNAHTNIHVYGDVAQGVEAYIEMHGPDDPSGDITFREGYLTMDNLVPAANVKVGQFEVNFGNHLKRRSTHADVQDNPFVGNTLMDPVAVQPGVEFSGSAAPVGWSLGITNGVNGAGNNFTADRGWALIPKVWGEFGPGITAAFSYYQVDHTDAAAGTPTGAALPTDNLFDAGAGESYSGIKSTGLAQSSGVSGAGDDVTAYQLDFGYEAPVGTMVNAWWGSAEATTTGGATSEQGYYGVDVKHPLTPQTYAAARYNVLTDEEADNNDQADRIQVALGHNLNEATQLKLEYVTQSNDDVAASTPTGTTADASGVIAEGSVRF